MQDLLVDQFQNCQLTFDQLVGLIRDFQLIFGQLVVQLVTYRAKNTDPEAEQAQGLVTSFLSLKMAESPGHNTAKQFRSTANCSTTIKFELLSETRIDL